MRLLAVIKMSYKYKKHNIKQITQESPVGRAQPKGLT